MKTELEHPFGGCMEIEAYIVNAFAEEIAHGNQAGVVFVEKELSEQTMQKIAFDIGKSETAFIRKHDNQYFIRWFSPLKEMPLCGHATLAAAKVLAKKNDRRDIIFNYNGGKITVSIDATDSIGMVFPKDDYKEIGFNPIYKDFFHIEENNCISCIQGTTTQKVAIILDKNIAIEHIKPNFSLMKDYLGFCNNGIGISRLSNQYDFETRYFNPWAGVNEDYVTGSIHTVLANYWGNVLGKSKLIGYQNSPRPGIIRLETIDNNKILIKGKAKIIFFGTFSL